MAAAPCTIKVLDRSHVSPPAGSVPNTSLPLTFFDLPWLLCVPMQRLFFYEFPCSTLQFTNTILPSLKTSLSYALETFYPFSAKLICPPSPLKPYIRYTDGDCVPFTVAESSVDFQSTIGYHPRDVKDLHPFVPQLSPGHVLNNTRFVPLLALQVTLFPGSGVCIGVTFNHVTSDGRSFNHFMNSWASILRSGGNSTACLEKLVPFFDRDAIKDPCGLESILLNDWWSWASDWQERKLPIHDILANKVRATFVMDRGEIERLKRFVLNQWTKKTESEQLRASTFVVTCAVVWTCLIKVQEMDSSKKHVDDEFRYFCFVADCRNRPEFTIPETYFGNCLAICFVRLRRSELLGENGVLAATRAIGNRVWEWENRALSGAEKWITNWKEISETGHLVTVSGSPKFRVYETNFGWGKLTKTELVHIDVSGAMYLGEARDGEGGIEIGLALKRDEMEAFNGFLEQVLKAI